jgi:arginase
MDGSFQAPSSTPAQDAADLNMSPARFVTTGQRLLAATPKLVTNQVTFVWGLSSCGQKKGGPELGPPLVCSDVFLRFLSKQMGWDIQIVEVKEQRRPESRVVLTGGTRVPVHQPLTVAATCAAIEAAMATAAHAGRLPVLIGGDHCLSMGSVRGVTRRHPDVCVIWFDAHADINTVATSPSGNLHGVPVAALLGLPDMRLAPGFEKSPFACLSPDRIAYVGLRDVDVGEGPIMQQQGIPASDMDEIARDGIAVVVRRALDRINPRRDLPIHLSIDIDGCDPGDMPSTGTRVGGGVRFHEALEMIRIVRETGLLVSCDFMEVNPRIGSKYDVAATLRNTQWMIAETLGRAPAVAAPVGAGATAARTGASTVSKL